jgi:hypothetical protein
MPVGVRAGLRPADESAAVFGDDDDVVGDPALDILGCGRPGLEGGGPVLEDLVEDLRDPGDIVRLRTPDLDG